MLVAIVVGAVLVLSIAAGGLWWVNNRLGFQESTAVYDIEEATDFIAARLPTELQQRLERDDVQAMLFWHLGYLRGNGMATFGGVDREAYYASGGRGEVVAHEDEAVDHVLAEAMASGRALDSVDVVVTVELSNQYLHDIGAFGPSVPLDDE